MWQGWISAPQRCWVGLTDSPASRTATRTPSCPSPMERRNQQRWQYAMSSISRYCHNVRQRHQWVLAVRPRSRSIIEFPVNSQHFRSQPTRRSLIGWNFFSPASYRLQYVNIEKWSWSQQWRSHKSQWFIIAKNGWKLSCHVVCWHDEDSYNHNDWIKKLDLFHSYKREKNNRINYEMRRLRKEK